MSQCEGSAHQQSVVFCLFAITVALPIRASRLLRERFFSFDFCDRSQTTLSGHISVTIDGPPENSSDLERAPGARSNGDEFSGGPSIVTEIWPLKV